MIQISENEELLYEAFLAGRRYNHQLQTDETDLTPRAAFKKWYSDKHNPNPKRAKSSNCDTTGWENDVLPCRYCNPGGDSDDKFFMGFD